jgi:hypothetical protein
MGYTVKMEDRNGTQKYFYCKNAPEHGHGSALASALRGHLNTTYPNFSPFNIAGSPKPGKQSTQAEEINQATDATWP